jgi:predicted DNA binding CopG/RHH family protein
MRKKNAVGVGNGKSLAVGENATTTISLRMPIKLLNDVKELARLKKTKYQTLIKEIIFEKVAEEISFLSK